MELKHFLRSKKASQSNSMEEDVLEDIKKIE